MKKLLFLLLLIPFLGNSQATFTAPVGYNTGVPTATPSGVGTRWRFDLLTGKKYTWLPGSLSWDEDARGIDQVAGCSAPLYTPGYNQSTFAVNACSPPVLYQWTGAAWEIPNEPEVYTAGTGISINGSNVITNTAPNVVQTLSIAGQDLSLSNGGGTVTIPAGADGNGIYSGSGSVPLISRQLYESAGYGALIKNIINDPLDASKSRDVMLPYDADLTDWQTKTFDDFVAEEAGSGLPIGAFTNSFEEGAQYFETYAIGVRQSQFDFTNLKIADERTTGDAQGFGLQYTAELPTIADNPTSIPYVKMFSDGLIPYAPVSYTNAAAPNNCIFYSTTLSKLAYKDPGGTVNPLY